MTEKPKAQLMDETGVSRALKRIAHEILEKNNGCENVILVGIRRRGVPIASMIAENIKDVEGKPVNIGELDITFYRDDLSFADKNAKDPTLNKTNIPGDIGGKTVVLVDDVLYTGRTVRAAIEALFTIGRPAAVQLAIIIDRGHRELPIRADYIGKNIPTSKSERIAVNVPEYDGELSVELFDIK